MQKNILRVTLLSIFLLLFSFFSQPVFASNEVIDSNYSNIDHKENKLSDDKLNKSREENLTSSLTDTENQTKEVEKSEEKSIVGDQNADRTSTDKENLATENKEDIKSQTEDKVLEDEGEKGLDENLNESDESKIDSENDKLITNSDEKSQTDLKKAKEPLEDKKSGDNSLKEASEKEEKSGWSWDADSNSKVINENTYDPNEEKKYTELIEDNGGVDVSPYGQAYRNSDGTWTYKYRISFQPVVSEDGKSLAKNLDITLPGFVENVKFNLVGSWEKIIGKDGKEYLVKKDVNIPMGIYGSSSLEEFDKLREDKSKDSNIKNVEYYEQTITDIYGNKRKVLVANVTNKYDQKSSYVYEILDENSWDKDYADKYNLNNTYRYNKDIDLNTVDRDKNYLPNSVSNQNLWYYDDIQAGYTSEGANRIYDSVEFQNYDEEYALLDKYGLPRVKKYSISSTIPRPIAIELSFSLSDKQVKKTPFVPVQAVALNHGDHTPYIKRPYQHIPKDKNRDYKVYDNLTFKSQSTSFFLYHPEAIKKDMFDINGLLADPNYAATKYTGDWSKIGYDIQKSIFDFYDSHRYYFDKNKKYVLNFGKEDLADIGVVIPDSYTFYSDSTIINNNKQNQGNEYIIDKNDESPKIRFRNISDMNIVGGGSVDVTPIKVVKNNDGSWKYSYRVSVQPVKSSDGSQTANSFSVVMPKFVKNVYFKLIGTWENDFGSFDGFDESKPSIPRDVAVKLGIINYSDINDLTLEEKAKLQTPAYEKLKGKNEYKNVFFKANSQEEFDKLTNAYGNFERLQAYGFIDNLNNPISFTVSFDAEDEQVKKTPYLPIDVRINYRSSGSSESPLLSEEENKSYGSRLNDFRVFSVVNEKDGSLTKDKVYFLTYDNYKNKWDIKDPLKEGTYKTHFRFIEFPELIKKGMFDIHGLYPEPGVDVTAYDENWGHIAGDMEPYGYSNSYNARTLRYAYQFALVNNSSTFFTSLNEDLADIAVLGPPDEETPPPKEETPPPDEETPPPKKETPPDKETPPKEDKKPVEEVEETIVNKVEEKTYQRIPNPKVAPKTFDPGIGKYLAMTFASSISLVWINKKKEKK